MTNKTEQKNWEEFRDNGFLWFINTSLQVFGWSIVFKYDDNDNLLEVYPARVNYRGFESEINDEGYVKLTKYMNTNSYQLLKEVNEEQE